MYQILDIELVIFINIYLPTKPKIINIETNLCDRHKLIYFLLILTIIVSDNFVFLVTLKIKLILNYNYTNVFLFS